MHKHDVVAMSFLTPNMQQSDKSELLSRPNFCSPMTRPPTLLCCLFSMLRLHLREEMTIYRYINCVENDMPVKVQSVNWPQMSEHIITSLDLIYQEGNR